MPVDPILHYNDIVVEKLRFGAVMFQLIYGSKLKYHISLAAVRDIAARAARRNAELGITGALFFNEHGFLQLLEGGRIEVNMLYHEICRDQRHYQLNVLYVRDTPLRLCPDWSMGLLTPSELDGGLFSLYGRSETFDPLAMRGEQAYEFIDEAYRSLILARSTSAQGLLLTI